MKKLYTFLILSTFLLSCKKKEQLPMHFDNVLIVGNSITIHPPNAALNWYGNWGMAASLPEKDFVHILAQKMNTTIIPVNISGWENDPKSFDFSTLKKYLSTIPDLVIIRLGENISIVTDLEKNFRELVNYIKSNDPLAKILITGRFWTYNPTDDILQKVAVSLNIPFVKLSKLDLNENISFYGAIVYGEDHRAYSITNDAVAAHPGDLGMQRIAETLDEAIRGNFIGHN